MPPFYISASNPYFDVHVCQPVHLIQAIGHQGFHGIFDFMMKNVILTILAILGVGEDPYKGPVDSQDSTRGPSEGPSPFYQPHNVF